MSQANSVNGFLKKTINEILSKMMQINDITDNPSTTEDDRRYIGLLFETIANKALNFQQMAGLSQHPMSTRGNQDGGKKKPKHTKRKTKTTPKTTPRKKKTKK